jgi:uncharacterized protein YyaL (SSP411 family)
MNSKQHGNRLIHETSPYLLQHAHNPVDWYPWGDEAFVKAKAEDKPVFLSVGYSACHWCHVMAHESFEDEDTAKLLNEHFVSVKVDREERPDIDEVYMNACQAMTGSGGWPLSIFMTPDKKPFYAGTYFPPRNAYGRTGFPDLLIRISELWRTEREALVRQGEKVVNALSGTRGGSGKPYEPKALVESGYRALMHAFDRTYGGFSHAPKFPMPHYLTFLLAYGQAYQSKKAIRMAAFTLEQMYRGGIFDHVGGGFSRYSTDERWLVPHFEKMLYDNALLLSAYSRCYAVTGNVICREAAIKICEYVLRDMRSPESAFYSAQDADSEGEEGRFYTWEYEELQSVLSDNEIGILEERYGVSRNGNFEGRNILHITGDSNNHADDAILQKLYDARRRRVPPLKDTKISASWNGLMIEALTEAGLYLGKEPYITAARHAADFILERMTAPDGSVIGIYGKSSLGFLSDHANIACALIKLYTATLNLSYLERARAVTDTLIGRFFESGENRFYMTGRKDEALFMRPRDDYDGAMPSGAARAIAAMLYLYRITGNESLQNILDAAVGAFSAEAQDSPVSHVHFLDMLLSRLVPLRQIVICAPRDDEEAMDAYRAIISRYLPFTSAIFYDRSEKMRLLLPSLRQYDTPDGFAAYICENFTCGAPVYAPARLLEILKIC